MCNSAETVSKVPDDLEKMPYLFFHSAVDTVLSGSLSGY